MALCPASYQFMRRAAKGGSLKDQSFVIGAANDGGEPIVLKNSEIQKSQFFGKSPKQQEVK